MTLSWQLLEFRRCVDRKIDWGTVSDAMAIIRIAAKCAARQSMADSGLNVSLGAIMRARMGRLQRQSRRAFWASVTPEIPTSELVGWCWARLTLIEKRAPSRSAPVNL